MANIPTKRLINLYEKALKTPGKMVKDKEWELSVNASRTVVKMLHYNTVVYHMEHNNISIGGAFSVTDRDYINGLIRLLGVSGHAYISNKVLHYTDDNVTLVSNTDRFGC